METLPRIALSRTEVMKRVARFKDLKGFDGGLPDSKMLGCENGEVEHVDLDPLDVVSFPPGMIRRFENITAGDPNQDSILMFVIGGDAPRAEFTDQAMHELETAGVWPSRS
jgi:hypothetical protein